MSLRLNLLPWRERQRQATVRRFRLVLSGSLLFAFVGVMVIDRFAHLRIQQQAAANSQRQAQVRTLEATLQGFDEAGARLEAVRVQHAQLVKLRVRQMAVAQLLVDIEQAMPSGLRLTAVQLQDQQLSIHGLVVSAAVLAQFMRDLQRSPQLHDLELRHVQGLAGGDDFLLTARMTAVNS